MDLERWESFSDVERQAWINSLTNGDQIINILEMLVETFIPMLEMLVSLEPDNKDYTNSLLAVEDALTRLEGRLHLLICN